jgi:hypothetical protein
MIDKYKKKKKNYPTMIDMIVDDNFLRTKIKSHLINIFYHNSYLIRVVIKYVN